MHTLKNTYFRPFCGGLLAGIMVCIGCAVYLACENRYVGAVLFSVALLTICMRGYVLYTGKIGCMVADHSRADFAALICGLAGNLLAVGGCSALFAAVCPALRGTAQTLAEAKLAQTPLQTVVRAAFCGVLMYIAVIIWKQNKSALGILFAIPVFILSGFEHSIADAGYLAAAGVGFTDWLVYTGYVLLGNTLGSLVFAALCRLYEGGTDRETIKKENGNG